MTNPRLYLTRMLLFVVAVAALAAAFAPQVAHAFMSSPGLNGLILGILLLGIVYICRQVFQLTREVRWIETFRTGRPGASTQATPRLLASMAAMLGERKGKLSLSAFSMRTLLDGIAARLDESRETSRYMIGLLIFLGLLGTFWGLMDTVRSIGDVISGLSVPTGTDVGSMFDELKRALEKPLGGMGFAFSSSLFGLAGSLVLGFLELQASQAQNRFFNDLEDWLSGQTRLSSGALMGEGEQPIPVYVQALLEQTADSLENLQRTMERGEESRIHANQSIVQLGDRLGALTDQMRTEQNLMLKLAETQMELKPIFARLADQMSHGGRQEDGLRTHLRNIDVQFSRLLEELSSGRNEMTQELRAEIRVLSRTLAALAERAAR